MQPLDLLFVHDRAVEDLIDIGEGDASIPVVIRPDIDRDALAAVLEAAGADNHHVVSDAAGTDPVFEATVDVEATTGSTAGLNGVTRSLIGTDKYLNLGFGHGMNSKAVTLDVKVHSSGTELSFKSY